MVCCAAGAEAILCAAVSQAKGFVWIDVVLQHGWICVSLLSSASASAYLALNGQQPWLDATIHAFVSKTSS
jgi:hypothetical protein